MSLLPESGPDDQQLVRYLLGLLPEEDAERLDEASIVDDEIAGRLRVVEDDLVDAYASGSLQGESLRRFESFYLSSPLRRQKVKFAGSLHRTVNQAAVSAAAAPGKRAVPASASEPVAFPVAFRPKRRMVPGAESTWRLAVAALLVLACGALLFWDARLRSGLTEAQRQGAALEHQAHALEQQLVEQRTANAETAKELARVRTSLADLAQQTLDQPQERSGSRLQALAAFAVVLLPPTRAVGPIDTLAVPADTTRIAFELRLESNEFARYQVVLKDLAANEAIWRSPRVAAMSSGDQSSVFVVVPAGLLKPQHYSLELVGQSAAGVTQTVGSYTVQILFR